MKLLITTQTVDKDDPVLGFFVRWIEEFAKHCENITVLCLRTGNYHLPPHVVVVPLGATRLSRLYGVIRESVTRRSDYDAVFAHMNPEYIVVAGWFWRLLGKRLGLWYTHKSVNLKLRIAVIFADIIFTASRESFRLKTDKLHIVGHGIDTDFFTPDPHIVRGDWLLSVGRLAKSKRHDLAIRAAAEEDKELRIAGKGPELEHLEALVLELGARVQFLGGLNQSQLRDEYRTAAFLIHTSETGSLDKVVLEALACGLPVRTNNPALKALGNATPAYVREHHSLQKLIPAIIGSLS